MQCIECNMNITDTKEDGVNGSDYYYCEDCEKGYNIIVSDLKGEQG